MIAPNGENSFWLDGISTGHKFCTLLGDEMINYVRKAFGLAKTAEDTCILGLSMGGFGALHTGLAYPDHFSRIGAMSSALIVHEVAEMKPGKGNHVANYEYYRECFGEPGEVLKSDNNPETLACAWKRCPNKQGTYWKERGYSHSEKGKLSGRTCGAASADPLTIFALSTCVISKFSLLTTRKPAGRIT